MWPSQRWNKLHAPGTGASRNANAWGRWWSQMVAVLSNYSQCQCLRKLLVWNDGTKPTRQARNHAGQLWHNLWLAVGMFNDFKRLVHILSDFSLRAVFCFWLWVFDAPAIQLWKCHAPQGHWSRHSSRVLAQREKSWQPTMAKMAKTAEASKTGPICGLENAGTGHFFLKHVS